MPFGIPSEDFHGGFGIPDDDDYIEEYIHSPEKKDAAKECEAKMLLIRALDQLYLLGYDSGFTNPAIEQLVTDIKFYLNGGKLNGSRIDLATSDGLRGQV